MGALLSPEILKAGAVKGLKIITVISNLLCAISPMEDIAYYMKTKTTNHSHCDFIILNLMYTFLVVFVLLKATFFMFVAAIMQPPPFLPPGNSSSMLIKPGRGLVITSHCLY